MNILNSNGNILSNGFDSRRGYAKKVALTEGQIQFQKHTAELNKRERTTIRGTLFEFNSVETSIQYMESEGSFRDWFTSSKFYDF